LFVIYPHYSYWNDIDYLKFYRIRRGTSHCWNYLWCCQPVMTYHFRNQICFVSINWNVEIRFLFKVRKVTVSVSFS
jgi:hypothetical protein